MANVNTVRQRVQRQQKIREGLIADASKILGKGVKSQQIEIFEAIAAALLRFDTEAGNFVLTDRNVRLINQLQQGIRKIILNSKYKSNVLTYLKDFDKIREVNISLHSSLNNVNASSIGLSKVQTLQREQVVNALLRNRMDVNLIGPVRDIITDSIVSGQSIPEAQSVLRNFIRGNSKGLNGPHVGFLERYTSQIGRDAIAQYDGLIQQKIATEFGFDAGIYVGSLIKDSRPQCVRWVNKGTLLFSELEAEINWAFNNGSGMIPETTPETFPVFRGGYNCRHRFTVTRS